MIRHVERYLDTMSSILSDKMFLAAMAEQYSIQEDLELVLQSSTQVYPSLGVFNNGALLLPKLGCTSDQLF